MVVVTIDSKPFCIHLFFFTLVNKYACILAHMCVCMHVIVHTGRDEGKEINTALTFLLSIPYELPKELQRHSKWRK